MPASKYTMTLAELNQALTDAALLEAWIAAVRREAKARLDEGAKLKDWFLGSGRNTREWIDEAKAVKRMRKMGLDDDVIMPRKILTPAQAESALRAVNLWPVGNAARNPVAALIRSVPGAPVVKSRADTPPAKSRLTAVTQPTSKEH